MGDQKPQNLPYGIQRRLELARTLMTEPRILLLDEPAAGLNPHEVRGLMNTIRKIQEENSLTVVTDLEIKFSTLLSSGNDDLSGPSINTVFHKFSHRFHWIGLRTGNDADRIPVICYTQLSCRCFPFFTLSSCSRHF